MAFLSNLHQPEVGILNSLVVLSPRLLGNHLYYCQHSKQYKFGSVRHMKMEMTSLPVDVRRSTTLVLKLPDSSLSR